MTPAVVVDIGNSRMKWGTPGRDHIVNAISLELDDEQSWQRRLSTRKSDGRPWLIAGVVPDVVRRFSGWLASQHRSSVVLDNTKLLSSTSNFRTQANPVTRIGIDRLLAALASYSDMLEWSGTDRPLPVAVVSVGTAVTVDFVSADGTHIGGAILPGPRLMAESLNRSTALLPEIRIERFDPTVVAAVETKGAIQLGISRAIVHAVDGLVTDWAGKKRHAIYITGGAAGIFRDYRFKSKWKYTATRPHLVLEGLRIVAGNLP